MQRLVNDADSYVDETVEGILAAHAGRLRRLPDEPRAIVARGGGGNDKVGIVTGGGSGHLPLFVGYVGAGLVDGCAVGNLFASPSAGQILAVMRAVSTGRGVLALYGNYTGDRLNFDIAGRLAGQHDIEVRSVRGADDVASAPPEAGDDRRGIAGLVFAYKTAGALAREGAGLEEVTEMAARTTSRTRSMGVALSPCTLPTVGAPNFSVEPGQMEIGMGIHGEPGVSTGPVRSADETTDELWDAIIADFGDELSGSVAVLVNGLGATPLEELYIVFRRAAQRATEAGLRIATSYVGEYVTSMDMAGVSLSLLALDGDLERLLATPADFWPAHLPVPVA